MAWFPAIGGRLSKLNFGLLARRGHPRCHCNEEGFGTLSRQLGNDEGYRSFRVGVSGRLTRWAAAPADGSRSRGGDGQGREKPSADSLRRPSFDAWAGSASRSDRG